MCKLLEIKNLSFGYSRTPFLKNINLDINKGEMIAVVGENGSGKSTLIKAINGILGDYEGNVIYNGKNLAKMLPIDRAREIAVLYQGCDCRFPFTCFEVVAMGLYPHRGGFGIREQDIDFIKELMLKTDTLSFANKPINAISGGEQQRVLLAKTFAQKPQLIFLDEAMSGLDIAARIKITNTIYDMCHKNEITAVNVLHDINLAFEKSDKIIAMKNGEVYAYDKPEALLNKKFFREIFNVEVEIDSSNKYFRIIL